MTPEVTQFRNEPSLVAARQPVPGQLSRGDDIVAHLRAYARERPEVAALWCFGIGFVLGWKLKPW